MGVKSVLQQAGLDRGSLTVLFPWERKENPHYWPYAEVHIFASSHAFIKSQVLRIQQVLCLVVFFPHYTSGHMYTLGFLPFTEGLDMATPVNRLQRRKANWYIK